jgi:rod shape-determining protein MreD
MFIVISLALGIATLVIQTTLLQLLPAWLGSPDLMFLLVVHIACRPEIIKGAIIVLVMGFLIDVFSGVFLGLYPVIYLLVFAFIKGVSRQIAISEFAYQVPLALISYLLVNTGMFVISFILAPESPPQWSWGGMMLQLIVLAVIGIPVFGIYDGIMRNFVSGSIPRRLLGARHGNRFKD